MSEIVRLLKAEDLDAEQVVRDMLCSDCKGSEHRLEKSGTCPLEEDCDEFKQLVAEQKLELAKHG